VVWGESKNCDPTWNGHDGVIVMNKKNKIVTSRGLKYPTVYKRDVSNSTLNNLEWHKRNTVSSCKFAGARLF
jgi:hypothetical protein